MAYDPNLPDEERLHETPLMLLDDVEGGLGALDGFIHRGSTQLLVRAAPTGEAARMQALGEAGASDHFRVPGRGVFDIDCRDVVAVAFTALPGGAPPPLGPGCNIAVSKDTAFLAFAADPFAVQAREAVWQAPGGGTLLHLAVLFVSGVLHVGCYAYRVKYHPSQDELADMLQSNPNLWDV